MTASSKRVVVVGAGGFAREAINVLLDSVEISGAAWELVGVVDPSPNDQSLSRLASLGVSHLGADDDWLADPNADHFVIAIGDPSTKRRLALNYVEAGLIPATLISPWARVGRRSRVGEGSVICDGAVVSTNVVLEEFVHINPNATIGHDARIGAFSSVNPAATVSGEVEIASCVLIGAGAVVLEGLRIGERAVVGASACVTKEVDSRSTVKGVPAR